MDTAIPQNTARLFEMGTCGWGVAEGAGGCDLGFHPPELPKNGDRFRWTMSEVAPSKEC